MMTLLILFAIAFAFYVAWGIYLAMILKWEDEQTVGLAYYGQPPEARTAFKKRLTQHARWLRPILALNAKLAKLDFARARVQVGGKSFPAGSCSEESVNLAHSYTPVAGDIFVVTQMKCGTTWMQQVVLEVLLRGNGDLVNTGRTMYSVSPWIEARKSVGISDAPTVGAERPSRIIKTHLSSDLLQCNGDAKYIYVARHPLSCFASCIDFVHTNVGAMAPGAEAFERWFTSPDLMWWGTWTDHVRGWWDRSQAAPNVLFVYFEDMKRDLAATVRQVAAFLDMQPLNEVELAAVVHKCSFAYMQEHQDNFEMHPPHILQTNAELFVAGTADRHQDVPPDARARVAAWVTREMEGSSFPLAVRYPDVVSS
jgi:hypothetical protein